MDHLKADNANGEPTKHRYAEIAVQQRLESVMVRLPQAAQPAYAKSDFSSALLGSYGSVALA